MAASSSDSTSTIRSGFVVLKTKGVFTSWIWKRKWLVLKQETLEIRKSQVRINSITLSLFLTFLAELVAPTKHCQAQGTQNGRAYRSETVLRSFGDKEQAVFPGSQDR